MTITLSILFSKYANNLIYIQIRLHQLYFPYRPLFLPQQKYINIISKNEFMTIIIFFRH